MQLPVITFVAGFSAGCLLCYTYIRLLKAKVASYQLYVSRRIDKQIANLLDRLGPDGLSDGGRFRRPRPAPRPGQSGHPSGVLMELPKLVSLTPSRPPEPAK
jgi:hypothetical protein